MTITMPGLTDAIIALITVASVAVLLSIAFIAAGAFFERGKTHGRTTGRAVPAHHPVQTDDARELVLR